MSLLSGSDWSFQMGEVDVHYEGNFNWILYDNWAGGSHPFKSEKIYKSLCFQVPEFTGNPRAAIAKPLGYCPGVSKAHRGKSLCRKSATMLRMTRSAIAALTRMKIGSARLKTIPVSPRSAMRMVAVASAVNPKE
ncbi:hypothetical protein FBZ98_11213 [Rhizobium sp. ERR 922]|nr:hypothetical protein FBZ98_11213 [Rhizobium sp. ERR 922]TWB88732.1 hypothetical protein FBZ97_11213 [Rhizobium sp. ERR 942]